MRGKGTALTALLFLFATIACDRTAQTRIDALETKLAEMGEQISALQESQKKLGADFTVEKMATAIFREQYTTASFDPAADEGFSRLDTSIGSFAVSIRDVRPYADGVRVRLDVGNLTSASVTGATFKVKWGSRTPDMTEVSGDSVLAYMKWQESLKEKETTIHNELKPGSWNRVTLTLPGTSPEDFGHLELSMNAGQISLYVDK